MAHLLHTSVIFVTFGLPQNDANGSYVISASVTGEKMLNTFCPGRGLNQDLLRGSQTLCRVAIKAGLYRKAVQV